MGPHTSHQMQKGNISQARMKQTTYSSILASFPRDGLDISTSKPPNQANHTHSGSLVNAKSRAAAEAAADVALEVVGTRSSFFGSVRWRGLKRGDGRGPSFAESLRRPRRPPSRLLRTASPGQACRARSLTEARGRPWRVLAAPSLSRLEGPLG